MSSRKNKSKKLKSLTHKVEHLRLEMEDREEQLRTLEEEFMAELAKFDVEDLDPSPQGDTPAGGEGNEVNISDLQGDESGDGTGTEAPAGFAGQEHEVTGPKATPEEVKKIWRQIASATHPDRTKNDEAKTELYMRAKAAMESGSIDEIYKIASQLGIEIPEDASEATLKAMETLAEDLEGKIKGMETSVLWLWGNTEPSKRTGIIDLYLGSKRKRRKKKQEQT